MSLATSAPPVWQIEPVARLDDSRWLDHAVWKRVVVRAPTAAEARRLATELERDPGAPPVGNESHAFRSGFADEKLYRVRRLSDAQAAHFSGRDGEAARILDSEILRAAPAP